MPGPGQAPPPGEDVRPQLEILAADLAGKGKGGVGQQQKDERGPKDQKKVQEGRGHPPKWFGEAKDGQDGRRRRSADRKGRRDDRGRSHRRKRSSSESQRRSRTRSRRRKAKRRSDRGPFGVGREVHYGDSGGSSSSESGFREGAPSRAKSQQLQLVEYSNAHPGRLASRLLLRMQEMLSKEGADPTQVGPGNPTPAVALNWVTTVFMATHRQSVSLRLLREMKTIARALDLVANGQAVRAGDVLAQRLKALELQLTDQGWQRAQFLELVEPEGPSLIGRDEAVMTSKELAAEMKVRRWQNNRVDQWQQERPEKGKGKEKGKAKDKKGKSKRKAEEEQHA